MKKVTITAAILMGTLLFGAGVAAAVPPAPVGPTDLAVPAAPPEPQPCNESVLCDLTLPTRVPPTLDPPTDIANPTIDPTDPTDPTGPTDPGEPTDPTGPAEPTDPPATTTAQPPVGQPRDAPAGVPTPNRIDTGSGPADPITTINWWVLAAPALALLVLVATGTLRWIRRTERRPS